jgi:hypothetical protein
MVLSYLSSFSHDTYYFLTEGVSLEFDIFESNLINLVVLGGLIVHRIFFPAYKGFSKREEFTKLAFLQSIAAEEELRLLLVEAYFDVFLKDTFLQLSLDFAYTQARIKAARRQGIPTRRGTVEPTDPRVTAAPAQSGYKRSYRTPSGLSVRKPIVQQGLGYTFSSMTEPEELYRIEQVWPIIASFFPSINPSPDKSTETRDEYISPIRITKNYLNRKRLKCMKDFCLERNLLLKSKTLSMQDLFIEDFKRLMLSLGASEMIKMEIKLLVQGADKDFDFVQDANERIDEIILGDDFVV